MNRAEKLADIQAHPLVEEIIDEGDDGIWVHLESGCVAPSTECGSIHEWNVTAIRRAWREFLASDGCPEKYRSVGRGGRRKGSGRKPSAKKKVGLTVALSHEDMDKFKRVCMASGNSQSEQISHWIKKSRICG